MSPKNVIPAKFEGEAPAGYVEYAVYETLASTVYVRADLTEEQLMELDSEFGDAATASERVEVYDREWEPSPGV